MSHGTSRFCFTHRDKILVPCLSLRDSHWTRIHGLLISNELLYQLAKRFNNQKIGIIFLINNDLHLYALQKLN